MSLDKSKKSSRLFMSAKGWGLARVNSVKDQSARICACPKNRLWAVQSLTGDHGLSEKTTKVVSVIGVIHKTHFTAGHFDAW